MRLILRLLLREIRATLRYPTRLRRIFEPARWNRLLVDLRAAVTERKFRDAWRQREAFATREYESYEQYLAHQGRKFDSLRGKGDLLSEYEDAFAGALRSRAGRLGVRGATVLCLGARSGAEVRVFRELGAFSIGIDVNPGEKNPWVVYGDFHDLQFADGLIDVVYTNSLDHAFDLTRVHREIVRVLRDGGRLIVEAAAGTDEGGRAGFYEATFWRRIDDLVEVLASGGLDVESRVDLTVPWPGQQIVLRKRTTR